MAFINLIDKRLDVGRTMFSSKLKKTLASSEAGYLLLEYIFEKLGFARVQVQLFVGNHDVFIHSKRAGFSYEGTSRKDFVLNGRHIDLHVFSMLDDDWP